MSQTIVFLFPGQGSQYPQMGRALFEQDSIFRTWMTTLDRLVESLSGESVLHQLYDKATPGHERFARILYTHPALFMIEYALTRSLIERAVIPDMVLGCSLGEFVAAAVAGVLDVEEALAIVVKQAQLIETSCPPGRMLAVLHNVSLYYDTPLLSTASELVAVNYDSHFVLAGTVERITEIQQWLTRSAILSELLPVSYAFHSSLIAPIELSYKQICRAGFYASPRLPFISSLYGTAVEEVSDEYFWHVVREPMHFSAAIQRLEKHGPRTYIDVGPAGTLANFTRRIISADSPSRTASILSPFQRDRENAARVITTYARRKS